jgi:hypothetical protein
MGEVLALAEVKDKANEIGALAWTRDDQRYWSGRSREAKIYTPYPFRFTDKCGFHILTCPI